MAVWVRGVNIVWPPPLSPLLVPSLHHPLITTLAPPIDPCHTPQTFTSYKVATMTSNNLVVADTPEAVDTFRMIALCGALKLEVLGMKGRGRSAYSIIKQEYGLRGNKQSVLDQFTAIKQQAKQERSQ